MKSREFGYKDIYGVSLNKYLKLMDTTVEKLIRQKEVKIEMIENNYQKLAKKIQNTKKVSDKDFELVQELQVKKAYAIEQLKRLKKYKES